MSCSPLARILGVGGWPRYHRPRKRGHARGRNEPHRLPPAEPLFHLANRDSEPSRRSETPLSFRNRARHPSSENGSPKPHRKPPPNRGLLLGNPHQSKHFFGVFVGGGSVSIREQARRASGAQPIPGKTLMRILIYLIYIFFFPALQRSQLRAEHAALSQGRLQAGHFFFFFSNPRKMTAKIVLGFA